MSEFKVPTVRVTFDPGKGLVQESGDSAFIIGSEIPVDLGTNVNYSPENPSVWSSIPSNLVQAIDYLAAGSGSSGGGGAIGGTISSAQVAFGTAANTIGGSANLTFSNTGLSVLVPVTGSLFLSEPGDGNIGLLVRDIGVDLETQVQPAVVFNRSALNEVKLDAKVGKLRMKSDYEDPSNLTGSIETVDQYNNPAPLNLINNGLQINGSSGSLGQVLVSSGSGYAPVWAAMPYTATTPADWNAPAPTTVQEAIDRLANAAAAYYSYAIP